MWILNEIKSLGDPLSVIGRTEKMVFPVKVIIKRRLNPVAKSQGHYWYQVVPVDVSLLKNEITAWNYIETELYGDVGLEKELFEI